MRRRLAFGAAVATAAGVLLSAAPPQRDVRQQDTITRTLRSAQSGDRVLRVAAVQGFIHVIGYDGDTVEVSAARTIAADDAAAVRQAIDEVELTTTVEGSRAEAVVRERGHTCGEHWNESRRARPPYRVTYDITVRTPRRTRLELCTINGGHIVVDRTAGDFDVANVNGRITMNEVAGTGQAITVNGPVTVTFAENPRGTSWFRTVNGEVRVTFRDGLSANFLMKSMNGGLYTDFDVQQTGPATVTPERRDGKFIYRSKGFTAVRVGDGGPEIKLETLNGDVRALRSVR